MNRLFHDFRRTGVRNLIRAGVPERVAMKISGHKTRSVFDRYNIIDERDLRDAARRLENYLAAKRQENQQKPADGYNLGTVSTEKLERTGDFDAKLLQ